MQMLLHTDDADSRGIVILVLSVLIRLIRLVRVQKKIQALLESYSAFKN